MKTTVVAVLFWRAFQVLVVIPTSIAATLLLAMSLPSGSFPVRDIVGTTYHWADSAAMRTAPTGTVLVSQCQPPEFKPGESITMPKVLCGEMTEKAIPIDEAVEETVGAIKKTYLVLVFCSFVGLFVFRPGRRFIGLQTTTA